MDNKEYVADSEDEDMLMNFSVLDTSTTAQSVHTPDTSLDLNTKHYPHIQPLPSLPPIAILPDDSASSSPAGLSIPKNGPSKASHIAYNGKSAEEEPQSPASLSVSGPILNVDPVEPPKPRPRPKPRPAYKIQPAGSNPLSAEIGTSTPYNHNTTTRSILPLQPNTIPHLHLRAKSPEASHTAQQSNDASTFSGDIAERTKMRSRAKATTTTRAKPKADLAFGGAIELTSESEDELSLLSPSKGKAKAKRKEKKSSSLSGPHRLLKRSKHASEIEVPDSTLNTLPMASSDVTPSSQLPPSDPPLTSSSLPPTSHPGLAGSPPSSPIPRVPSRKRKKPGAVPFGEEQIAQENDTDSQMLMPPPPVKRKDPHAEHAAHSMASTFVDAGPSSSRDPTLKAKSKARKKQAVEDEEGWGEAPKPKGKQRTRVDDDDEDDWEGSPKHKVQRKNQRKKNPKKKTQKAADDEPREDMPNEQRNESGKRLVVEVVVSPSKRRSPQKSRVGEHEESERTKSDIDAAHGASTGEASTSTAATMLLVDVAFSEPPAKDKGKAIAKKRAVVLSDGESDGSVVVAKDSALAKKQNESIAEPHAALSRAGSWKENDASEPSNSPPVVTYPTTPKTLPSSAAPTSSRASSLIPKTTGSMSELIRRANSKPGSPFATPRSTHSPFAKSSKTMLKRIAPLHPNRRTPPPPPPRPPPPKKTKKQLEMEEQWEMELEESVEGWFAMSDGERAALRRAKRDAIFGFDD